MPPTMREKPTEYTNTSAFQAGFQHRIQAFGKAKDFHAQDSEIIKGYKIMKLYVYICVCSCHNSIWVGMISWLMAILL
jgi:hypothetical protein